MIIEIDVPCVGGLGNQLFELATAIACRPSRIIMPTNVDRQGVKMNYQTAIFSSPDLNKLVEFTSNPKGTRQPHVLIQERQWHYDPTLFSSLRSGVHYLFRGYFQCYKNFHSIRHELQTKWFPPQLIKKEQNERNEPKQKTMVVGIHVRRGDYLNLADIHGPLSTRYYERAIQEHFPYASLEFIIVSDDLNWCRQQDVFRKLTNVRFFNGTDVQCFTELREKCDGLILANSTFSWWAAYLSTRAAKIVAPSTWFGRELEKKYRVSDLFPPEWHLVSDSPHVSPSWALHKYIRPTLILTGKELNIHKVDDALRVGFPHVVFMSSSYPEEVKYKEDARVEFHHGGLSRLLETITQPVTFFFDSKGELMDELKAIAAHPIKTHTILIQKTTATTKKEEEDVIGFIQSKINKDYTIQHEPNNILVATILHAHKNETRNEKNEKDLIINLKTVKTRILSPNVQKYALRYETTRTMLADAGFQDIGLEKTGLTPGSFAGGLLGYISVLQRHVSEMDKNGNKKVEPLLTLEDDCVIEPRYLQNATITLPKNTDLVYVGVSCCGLQSYVETDCRELVMAKVDGYPDLVQIFNMLSTHALLWMSRDVMVEAIRRFRSQLIHAHARPWDCTTARLQEHFYVYAMKTPLMYQGTNQRDESLTRIRLDGPYVSDDRYELWKRTRCIGWYV